MQNSVRKSPRSLPAINYAPMMAATHSKYKKRKPTCSEPTPPRIPAKAFSDDPCAP